MKITRTKIAPLTKKRKAIMEAIPFLARKLGIANYDVTVCIDFKYSFRKLFNTQAECRKVNERRYIITIDADLPNDFAIQIVAHELVHVKQYIKGELSEDKDGFQLWKGKHVKDTLRYVQTPWEREAMKKEALLAHQYIDFVATKGKK